MKTVGTCVDLNKNIIEKELCARCGTCIGVCPVGALGYDSQNMRISYNQERCIGCNRCSRVCPGGGCLGLSSDYLGKYIDIINARSTKSEVWQRGASGGVVTQILITLLENNVVDGVIVCAEEKNKPGSFSPRIVENKEAILDAASSKYVIIPHNVVLAEIPNYRGRIAYVGLPCEVQGLRMAMAQDKQLESKIAVIISLFCGFNLEKKATDFLIQKSGGNRAKDIVTMLYRAKYNETTGFYIEFWDKKRGKEVLKNHFISKHGYTFLNIVFSPRRCIMCYDYSGEQSDISVGDSWDKKGGWSRVIIRTEVGRKTWELVKGYCSFEEVNQEDMVKSQGMVAAFKKTQIAYRARKMKNFPQYGVNWNEVKNYSRLKACILYYSWVFFHTKVGEIIIRILPFGLMEKISRKIKEKEI